MHCSIFEISIALLVVLGCTVSDNLPSNKNVWSISWYVAPVIILILFSFSELWYALVTLEPIMWSQCRHACLVKDVFHPITVSAQDRQNTFKNLSCLYMIEKNNISIVMPPMEFWESWVLINTCHHVNRKLTPNLAHIAVLIK